MRKLKRSHDKGSSCLKPRKVSKGSASCISCTTSTTHTDPVGLNFDVNDLNSSETNEISSTWANYLPQFVKRRMAITGAATGTTNSSSQGPRKNSLDSEISFSVRHVSVESRRNSVDSQVSEKEFVFIQYLVFKSVSNFPL